MRRADPRDIPEELGTGVPGQGPQQQEQHRRSRRRRATVAAVVCLALSLVAGTLATLALIGADDLAARRTEVADAKVVGFDTMTVAYEDGDEHEIPVPQVRFVDRGGAKHVVRHEDAGDGSAYEIGESLSVEYDPGDPEGNYDIGGGKQSLLVATQIVMWGACAVLLVAGVANLGRARRMRATERPS